MNRYFFLSILLLFSLSGFAQNKQPNIIIILTDDMGVGDIGAFGGKVVPTPNIDRMAKQGLKLTQYYSAAPICSPSRAGLLTGNYPGRWNFSTYLDNKKHNKDAQQADYLNPEVTTMAKVFKASGYATAHFGKWHLGGGRDVTNAPGFEAYGFDEHASTYESPDPDPLLTATNWIWSAKDSIKRWDRTAYFVDKTLDFMKHNAGKPCFINLWPDDVHTPWVPKDDGRIKPLGQEERRALELVMVEYDKQIGRLLSELEKMGQAENTIVIFTSDNGPLPHFNSDRTVGLRGSKLSLYEGGINMPFFINWKGHIPAGKTDNSLISAVDLLPSLAKLAKVTLPKIYDGDGVDRSDVLLGKPSPRKEIIFWEYGRNDIAFKYPKEPHKSPNLAARLGKWKLLMNHDGNDVQLFDLEKDPQEKQNVASKNSKVLAQIKSQLAQWWAGLPKLN